jgi:hypothetical protein
MDSPEIPFTTISIEELYDRQSCDVYVTSPGIDSLHYSINVHFTFWKASFAFSSMSAAVSYFI